MQVDDSKITITGVCQPGDTSCNKLGNWPGKNPGYTDDVHDRHKCKKVCIESNPAQVGPNTRDENNRSGIEDLANFAKYGKAAVDVAIWIGDYGKPAYKQIKSLGNAGPAVEGVASGVLQYLDDIDNSSLSQMNKITRAGVVGIEAGITDIVSGPVALKGAAIGASLTVETGPGVILGGAGGYVAGNWVASTVMDNLVWHPVNSWLGIFP
jgi:hypothetical protein